MPQGRHLEQVPQVVYLLHSEIAMTQTETEGTHPYPAPPTGFVFCKSAAPSLKDQSHKARGLRPQAPRAVSPPRNPVQDSGPGGKLETNILENIPRPFRQRSPHLRCFLDLWEGAI